MDPLFAVRPQDRRGHGKIIVVDDEPSICRMLTMALGRRDFDVLAVTSPWQGLALLEQEHPDAIVVDLCMPDMPGDLFFRRAVIRQPWLRHRTLFVTGDVSDEGIERVQRTGCPYLLKPFDIDTAMHAIVAILPEGVAPLATPARSVAAVLDERPPNEEPRRDGRASGEQRVHTT